MRQAPERPQGGRGGRQRPGPVLDDGARRGPGVQARAAEQRRAEVGGGERQVGHIARLGADRAGRAAGKTDEEIWVEYDEAREAGGR